jgi:hypothetical protein
MRECMYGKDAGIILEILKNMDSFSKSMDSYRIVVTNPDSKKVWSVPYKTNPGFVSHRGSLKRFVLNG